MKEKLDIIFSRYIRLRDTDEFGYGECITCGKIVTYKDGECGHFRHRRHECTRWHPQNAHLQCFECNRGDDMAQYIAAMLNRYPDDLVYDIIQLSNQDCKLTAFELKEMHEHFKIMASELAVQKLFIVKL